MADNYALLHSLSSLKTTLCKESSLFAVTFFGLCMMRLQEPKPRGQQDEGTWQRSKVSGESGTRSEPQEKNWAKDPSSLVNSLLLGQPRNGENEAAESCDDSLGLSLLGPYFGGVNQ
ncbi:hypothetical protein HAX54_010335 [Datura stramonium]|uniref:Uncharacterized protein n=1 Tax=Datura stramonium TaxID=4076 RepID=A0ABS8TG15_DATST|nr:hypothetical protein [Datura stramonium]